MPLVDLRLSSHQTHHAPYPYQEAARKHNSSREDAQGEFFGGYFYVEDSDTEEDAMWGSNSSSSTKTTTAQQHAANSEGIVRCSNCMAYISPFMAWASNSTHCVCNLCGISFELPHSYLTLLDQYRMGLRGSTGMATAAASEIDRHLHSQRLELWRGSVDFVAPRAFSAASKLTQLQSKRRDHLRALQRTQHESNKQQLLRQQHQQHLAEQQEQQQQLDGSKFPGQRQQQQQQQQQQQMHLQQGNFGGGLSTACSRDADALSVCDGPSSSSSSMRPCIVFVVDVTATSITAGLANAVAVGMEQVLQEISLQVDVCIMLVADRLYFIPSHSQGGSQQQQRQQGLQLLVVDDVSDPFLPIPVEHCFFRPEDKEQVRSISGGGDASPAVRYLLKAVFA